MERVGFASIVGTALMVTVMAVPAAAQVSLGGFNLEGDVEAGLRLLPDEPSKKKRAKFEEYREISEAPFLPNLQLRLFRPDESYSTEIAGSKWGQRDQEYSLRTGRLGLWEFGFDWNQTPHVFSTTARTLAVETAPGVFTLPTPRPSLTAYNTAPELDRIAVRWDTARMFFRLTPGPDFDITATYTRTTKDGYRPFSTAFGSPGNNFMEILEPIDQTVHDVRLRGTIARETWQLQFGYDFSMFENALRGITVDNPCFANVASCGATDGGAAAPARARVSLPPENMAHTVHVAGGVNLPMRTRVNANVAYSVQLQNEAFLPHTIDPVLGTSGLLALPAKSLDGLVTTLLINLSATSRPVAPLTLSASYRLFDLDDSSPELVFPGHVINDRGPVIAEDRQAGRFDYTRQNLDLGARWRFGRPVALKLGAGLESWERNSHRELQDSYEAYAKGSLDVTPNDWLLARLTYRPSVRRTSSYHSFAHQAHTTFEEATPDAFPQGQLPSLRKFDEGVRDRHQLDALLQISPSDVLTTTFTTGYRSDDYSESPFGLQTDDTLSVGFDFSWTPIERLNVSGGYVHELMYRKQRSRSRIVVGTTTFDLGDFDWISSNIDTVDTFNLGAAVRLIQDLDWTFGANYTASRGEIRTRNPGPLQSGTLAQQITAAAKRMPPLRDSLLGLDTALRYHFWKKWTASFGYAFESFEKHDWRTDNLVPFTPGITSIWLGNDLKDYSAHIVTLTLGYRFK